MRASLGREQVVERFYDAVLTPSVWPEVLQDVADLLGGGGAALLSVDRPEGIWVRVDPAGRELFYDRFVGRNPINDYAMQARKTPGYRPALISDEEISAADPLSETAYYNEFMRAYDGPSALVFDLGVRGMSAAFNVSRTAQAGAFTAEARCDAAMLHPHLTRAFWLTVEMGLRADLTDGVSELVEASAQGMASIDKTGLVLHANAAARAIFARRDGLTLSHGALSAHLAEDRAALSRALHEATRSGEGRSGGWLAVRRAPPAAPLSVAIMPLGRNRSPLFESRAAALVYIVDPEAKLDLGEAELRRLFGLTGAQARLAARLAEGQELSAAAADLGVSIATARTHLQDIFARTQTNRQPELVRLLVRAAGLWRAH